jgi:hypothetical protein
MARLSRLHQSPPMNESAHWQLSVYYTLLESSSAVMTAIEVRSLPLLHAKQDIKWFLKTSNAFLAICRISTALYVSMTRSLECYHHIVEDERNASTSDKNEGCPMPLKNVRQETFCQRVAAGHSATAAYAAAARYNKPRERAQVANKS